MCMADLGSFKPGEARGHQKARDAAPNWTCTKNHRMTSVEKYVVDSNANLDMIRFYIVFSSIKGDHKKVWKCNQLQWVNWRLGVLCLGVFLRDSQSEAPISSRSQSGVAKGSYLNHWRRKKKKHPIKNLSSFQQCLTLTTNFCLTSREGVQTKENLNSEATCYRWSDRKLYQVGAKLTI